MKLAAQPGPPPRCASFSDEEAVRRYERAMRVHRAQTEAYEITPLEDRVDGAYRVQGSGGVYLVDVVDGTGEADTCTCVDFLTNDLGTCKHLEAVRRALRNNRTLRSAYEALGPRPTRPTITVQAQGGLRLIRRGLWGKALQHRAGWRQEPDGRMTPLVPAALTMPPGEVRVVHAAGPAHARIVAREQLNIRRERVKAAIEEGRLHLDRLAVPLLPFQREGAAYLIAQGRAMLADDVGLGKTLQVIAACETLCAYGEADRVLIVAPASTLTFWVRELERFAGAAPALLSGDGLALRTAMASGARYKLTSHETVVHHADAFAAIQPDILVLDEAQRAKNFRARTAVALRSIQARFVYALTSLPLDRHLDDLYALVQLVDDQVLAPLWRFNLAFYEQDARGSITGYKNLSKLRLLLAPLLVRRRKEEVIAQLLPFTRQSRFLPLLADQQARSRQLLGELADLLALPSPDPSSLLSLVSEARKVCADPSVLAPDDETLGSPKLDELEQIVEELVRQGPHRILVFCEHGEPLRRAAARLQRLGLTPLLLDRPQDEARQRLLERRFTDSGEALVALMTDEATAKLQLPQVGYHIHLDLPLGPAQLERRTAVGHRARHTRGLTELFLCAEAGLERSLEASLLLRRPLNPCPLERALISGRLNAEALGVLRRLIHDTPRETTANGPPKTPPVAHLSLSPVPSPVAVDPTTSMSPVALPLPLTPEPDERSPDTQRTGVQPEPATSSFARARERLRLASIVLDAGFPCDAARAAHQGLAQALTVLLRQEQGNPPAHLVRDHHGLVAALFRVLGPKGKLPPALHGTLARLHDLAALDDQGIHLDAAQARDAMEEATQWIQRIEEMITKHAG
ncbi:MAG: SNF2-related protein [Myxococcales bacterium]|nr:SNF2-related protein [Polyangiaceae bacterium]MDW8249679.1 SNF2-related protein [Myxococcales bacterium]